VTTELPDSPTRVANGRLLAALTGGLREGLDRQLADLETQASTANLSVSNRVRLEVLAGWALLLARDPHGVHRRLTQMIPLLVERGPLGAHMLTTARLYMGTAWLDLDDVDQARTYLNPALEAHLRLYSTDTPERADLWVGLARVELHAGNAAAARTLAERADAFWRQWDPASPWAGEAAYWLGRTLEASGAGAAAGEPFRRAGQILGATTLPRLAALAGDARARGRASASTPAIASPGR